MIQKTQDENAPGEQQSGKETEYPTDTDGYSADRKRDRRIDRTGRRAKAGEFPLGKRTGDVEMKLWDVGKDQAETGSLKNLLDGSDEDLEEWKD